METNITGVVLCGGESRRMGRDKGLIKTDDKNWAQLVAAKLEIFSLPVVISINSSQFDSYVSNFEKEKLIIDNSEVSGPLNGLLTVHKYFENNDLLIMACDMPGLPENKIQHIIDIYSSDKEHDFYCYYHDGFFEPFCGIYTARGLKKIPADAEIQSLKDFSFQNVLNNGLTKKVPLSNPEQFINRNKPD